MKRSFFAISAVLLITTFSSISVADKNAAGRHQEADVSHPLAAPFFQGLLTLEPYQVGREMRLCPVLKDQKSGRTYRVRTNEGSGCENDLRNCKPGALCVIKGQVGAEGDLWADSLNSFAQRENTPPAKFEPKDRLTKKTMSGAVFEWVSERGLRASGVVDPKKFGEAWQEPEQLPNGQPNLDRKIWSDVARNRDGSPASMSFRDAELYCKGLGAVLPSGYPKDQNGSDGFPSKDSDYVRLREFMGASSVEGEQNPAGYVPKILPNLFDEDTGIAYNQDYWSSSSPLARYQVSSTSSKYAAYTYTFRGRGGALYEHTVDPLYTNLVRCVIPAPQ